MNNEGFEHFVRLTLVVQEIECLLLARQGHRRALFKFNVGQKNPENQTWLCPLLDTSKCRGDFTTGKSKKFCA